MLPTALIDLPSLQIKKMHAYNEYVMFRREYRELELDKLFKTRSAQRLPEFGQCVILYDNPDHPSLTLRPVQAEPLHGGPQAVALHRHHAAGGHAGRALHARAAAAL